MARDETAIVQLQVRLREDLRREIDETARARGVSLNAEIVGRLEHTRDRTGLVMEVLTLAFGRKAASILVLIGAIMHAEGMVRSGIDWADDPDAYKAALDEAMAALTALRSGEMPKPVDEMTWEHAAGVVNKLAGTNLTKQVGKLITEHGILREHVSKRRPR
jgi:hypothetical protein